VELVMYAEERQQLIVLRAHEAGRVKVAELADDLGVATETIRRDLAVLESQGLLQRVHGGAIPAGRMVAFEPEVTARAQTMAEEKRRIAKAALAELPDGGVIFIEAGSTAAVFAELLPLDRELTVVTNSLPIALALARHPTRTVLTVGGRVRRLSMAEVDDWALRGIAGARVDVAFVGTNGVSARYGLTTPDIAEAAVKRAVLGVGSRTILLADHSKVGAVSLCRYGEPRELDLLITDSGLPAEAAQELEAAGLAVMTA
jgi:DeoR family fructose operon transcriptional repressor